MYTKKILVIGLIILFLSNIVFPVIPGVFNDLNDKNCNYNNLKINFQQSSENRFSYFSEFNTFIQSSKVNRIASLLYLPAIFSLNRIIHPLSSSPLELSDEDLEALAYMSNCKIVGLGEATHGTKEFFQLKHRIFKYLVENHGFRIFAFECDMGESYYVNNFITKGEGDIEDIMKNIMHFWTWRTEEVKELLLWMREYNDNKTDEDKIHFIGVDCQFFTYQADIILNYFNKTNVSLPENCVNFLNVIDQIGWNLLEYYKNMTLDQKEWIDLSVDILLAKFEDHRDELISNSSEFEFQFIKQIALNIKQVNDFYYNWTHGSQFNYRDLYMAENTLWTSDLFGNNTKVALWAHNGHVNNYRLFGAMGFHLKKELKEKYQILGFAFSLGNFTAVKYENGTYYGLAIHNIKNEPAFGSINYIFHNAKYDNFILRESDIRIISFFNRYIWKPHYFISIGAVFSSNYSYYLPIVFKKHFDVMIYWDTTTAAEQLT
jgi:erythromycin esterase